MNYKQIYETLIGRARNRILESYTESHHIIPRCMGGDNSEINLVELTAEEHYVAHQLLVRIYPQEYGLIKAAVMMALNTGGNRPNNKLYGWLRKKHSESTSGKNNINFGKPRSAEVKEKISLSNIGKSKGLGVKKGPMKDETKKKLSEALMGRPSPHMVGDKNPMFRPGVKERAIASRKGQPRQQKQDKLIFKFEYIATNEIFIGTRQEFRYYSGLLPSDVSPLVRGVRVSSKGWRIVDSVRFDKRFK